MRPLATTDRHLHTRQRDHTAAATQRVARTTRSCSCETLKTSCHRRRRSNCARRSTKTRCASTGRDCRSRRSRSCPSGRRALSNCDAFRGQHVVTCGSTTAFHRARTSSWQADSRAESTMSRYVLWLSYSHEAYRSHSDSRVHVLAPTSAVPASVLQQEQRHPRQSDGLWRQDVCVRASGRSPHGAIRSSCAHPEQCVCSRGDASVDNARRSQESARATHRPQWTRRASRAHASALTARSPERLRVARDKRNSSCVGTRVRGS